MTIRSMSTRLAAAALVTSTLMASQAAAVTLEFTVTNNQAEGGLFLTPLYLGLHDGTFDAFDEGAAATAGVELLAEEGSPMAVAGERRALLPNSQGGVITGPAGFGSVEGQPPVLDPGETATLRIRVDPTNRYLTFLSMVIPSNDAFIGNDDPRAYQLFDDMGNFTGLGPIEVTLGQIWDAGTEVNNNIGAAFNSAGGIGTVEGGTISLLGDGVADLFGQGTAAGTSISALLNSSLATITVAAVPLPATLPLLGAALLAGGAAARRRKAQR